ncbi:MAG: hypothetical protein ACJAXH_003381 [Colwellia sp.]|jgi:hypothetical protein
MKNNIFFAISEVKSQARRLLQIFWVTELIIITVSLQRIIG